MRRIRISRLQHLVLDAGSGLYSLAGHNSDLLKARHIIASLLPGTYTLAGNNATLTRQTRLLNTISGTYSYVGSPATLTWATSPNITTAPVIIGIPTVGTPVAYTAGNVTGSPVPTRTQQWILDGNTISSATASTYTPITSDAGHNLSIRQIETNSFGSANRTSTGVVIASQGVSTLEQDWTARSTSPGVFLAQNFNTQASVTNNTWPDSTASRVVWERTIKRSGNGACRFNKLASDSAASGQIKLNFDLANSSDGSHVSSVTRGNGTQTWYQCTVYCPEPLLRYKPTHTAGGNGGLKALWISGGGTNSNTDAEIVVTNQGFAGFPIPYYQNGSSFADFNLGVSTPNNSSNFRFLPAVDDGTPASPSTDNDYAQRFGPLYQNLTPGNTRVNNSQYPNPGDIYSQDFPDPNVLASGTPAFPADGWITMMLFVDRQAGANCTIKFWAAKPGDTPVLLVNATGITLGSTPHGALWFSAYDTNRDGNSAGVPDTYYIVTEFIASSQTIAWPAVKEIPASAVAGTSLAWTELANTSIASVSNAAAPAGSGVGTNGVAYKIHAWNSFQFDYRTGKIYCAANGGHGDWSGNEVDCLSLYQDTPAWQELRAYSSPVSVDTNHYPDGRPTSRHSQYGHTIDVYGNRLMTWAGWRYGIGQYMNDVDSFNLDTNDWSAAGTTASISGNTDAGGSVPSRPTVVDPRNGNVWIFGNFSITRWNRSTNTYTIVRNGTSAIYGYYTPGAWDSKRNQVFVVGSPAGGAGLEHHTYAVDTDTITSQTLSGSAATAVQNQNQSAMVYVPKLDAFLLRVGTLTGGTIYRIDASTFACTTLATTGGASIPNSDSLGGSGIGCFNRMFYSAKTDCIYYYPTYSGNCWRLKL